MSDAKEYTGTQKNAVVISETAYYSNKVTVTGLTENTQYYYQMFKNGDWTNAEKYSTKSFSSFSFLYVGDPQIGASKGQTSVEDEKMNSAGGAVTSSAEANLAARNDGYNWNKVLKKAVADHSDSDGMVLRTQLTGDGQEHTAYNKGGEKNEDFLAQNNCYVVKSDTKSGIVVNPEGTVYVEANSSTGSKFYNLIATQQDFIAERSQTWTPSYSVIDVNDDSFSITTYDGESGHKLGGSSTYTIVKDDRAAQEIKGTDCYEKMVGDAAFTLDATAEGTGFGSYKR